MPIWIDNFNSDHDYSRENYVAQIQNTFYRVINDEDTCKYVNGIMIYGMSNEPNLKLKQKYSWLRQLFWEL